LRNFNTPSGRAKNSKILRFLFSRMKKETKKSFFGVSGAQFALCGLNSRERSSPWARFEVAFPPTARVQFAAARLNSFTGLLALPWALGF
jgi:hypothetical protein